MASRRNTARLVITLRIVYGSGKPPVRKKQYSRPSMAGETIPDWVQDCIANDKGEWLMTRRFEFREGTSRKFWEVEITHVTSNNHNEWVVTRSWGRIGQSPTSKQFCFPYESAAREDVAKLIRTKLREGYNEVLAPKPPPKAAPIAGVPTGRMVSSARTLAPPQPSTTKKCSRCKDRVASSGTQNSHTPLCSVCISAKVEPQKPASKDDNPMDRFRLIELD